MKRFIYFLIFFLSFISFSNVSALTYNKGKIYEIYYQESNVNVFASDETYHSMDYNGIMVKSTVDDYIFYCVAPETYLPNYSETTTNTHYIYEGKDAIINNTRLTEETYKKISLLAYYGYGYKDNKINHSDKKWYGITQVMIWRVLRPDINYVFKTSRYGKIDPNLYLKEVKEMETLVANHDKVPSFSGKDFLITRNETLNLEDTNKVLDSYEIINNSITSFKIKDNTLTIFALNNGSVSLDLKKKAINNNVKFYKSRGSNQDLIIRGDVSFSKATLNLTVEGGTLEVYKVNENNVYTEELEGTLFGIYDDKDNLILEFDITNEYEHFYLPYGKYYLKEIKAMPSYKKDDTIYTFFFNEDNDNYSITIPNYKIKGELLIEKLKGGGLENYVLESGALFEIKNIDTEEKYQITTDEKGIARLVLPYGKYEVKQLKGSSNYSLIANFIVNIAEEKIYKYELRNIKKSDLKIIKKDYSSKTPIKDTVFNIYKSDNTFIYEGKTNEQGELIVSNLEKGSYYLKEIKASKYYKLDEKRYDFTILEDGEVIEIEVLNERNRGTLEFLKVDSKTNLPLAKTKIRVYYDKTNELVYEGKTDSLGKITLDNIEAGTYYIEEIIPTYGYLLNKEKIYFSITDDKEVVSVTMTNEKIEMPNTSVTYSYNFILSLLIIIFVLRKNKKNEEF